MAPYDPRQVTRGWVWRRNGWFPCLGGGMIAHQKNREIKVYRPWVTAIQLEDTTVKEELAAVVGGMLERRRVEVRACGGNVIALIRGRF